MLIDDFGITCSLAVIGTPDDETFQYLALTYSQHNPAMASYTGCEESDEFYHGITNGAEWYSVKGGKY